MRVLPINEEESPFIGYYKGSIVFCVLDSQGAVREKDASITSKRRSLFGWFAMVR